MKRYYFIDDNIYFQNKKLPPRKVELFNISIYNKEIHGMDSDGNWYEIPKSQLIIEEDKWYI